MDRIDYLRKLLHLMITEDLARPLERNGILQDKHIVRRLPVVSHVYINPVSVRLKTEQEARVAAMAAPEDNPWLAKLRAEYVGKILYDSTGATFAFLMCFMSQTKEVGRATPAGRPQRNQCISKAVNLWCMIGTKQPALTAGKYY